MEKNILEEFICNALVEEWDVADDIRQWKHASDLDEDDRNFTEVITDLSYYYLLEGDDSCQDDIIKYALSFVNWTEIGESIYESFALGWEDCD